MQAHREMTPAEVRDVQLQVLQRFADWCSERDLEFQLAFGTLLGAVRHQGFIPWDDDIDVAMPREDYERFCREFAADQPNGLEVGSLATSVGWPLPFAKVWDARTFVEEHTNLPLRSGVGLDLFPIDAVAGRGPLRSAQVFAIRFVHGAEILASVRPRPGRSRGKALVLRTIGPVARRVSPRLLARIRDRIGLAWSGAHRAIAAGPYASWSAPREAMISSGTVDFEELTMPAPAGVATVLTAIYGDYMTPPPATDRVTHHAATAFWLR